MISLFKEGVVLAVGICYVTLSTVYLWHVGQLGPIV